MKASVPHPHIILGSIKLCEKNKEKLKDKEKLALSLL